MLKEGTINTGQVSINYVHGPPSGQPLVLLHGVTSRWQAFMPVITDLMSRWHLYALDLRGHGLSGRIPGKYRFVDYAQDVPAFLQTLVGEPAILLGHSLGAMVSIKVAVEVPERVRALVLEDPPLYMKGDRLKESPFYKRFVAQRELISTKHSVEELASALAGLLPELDAAALRSRAKALSQVDPDVLAQIIAGTSLESYDTDTLLKRISAPTLLLQGDPSLGAAVDDAEAKHAASLIKDCTFVRFSGVGHGIHTGQPVPFLRVVIDFLESL